VNFNPRHKILVENHATLWQAFEPKANGEWFKIRSLSAFSTEG